MRVLVVLGVMLSSGAVGAADMVVRVQNAPASGRLVFQVYDSANAFGDFRDPASETVLEARGDGDYRISELEPGTVALLVYVDENDNGRIDKNFIGIPRETLGMSNNYRPKGPPSFDRASVDLTAEGLHLDVELYRVLGQRGRLGVGVGVIGRSSPYVGSENSVIRPIPAITYNGERLQWFGPTLRYGVAGSGRLRLALAFDYRIGAYEEDDSDVLTGLGDREDTLLGGLSMQYELPAGLDVALSYQHDVLDRIGGGAATVRLSRGYQLGIARLVPQASINWLSGELGSHDFGVPAARATTGRPAYALGSTVGYEVGLGSFIELSEDWRLIVNVAAEFLDAEISRSPIVADDTLITGFAIVSYVF